MNTVPVTVDDFLDCKDLDAVRKNIRRALDAERAAYRQSMNALSAKLDAARKTLRDEFAMAALTGYVAEFTGSDCSSPSPATAASSAYDYAEAMMQERERRS